MDRPAGRRHRSRSRPLAAPIYQAPAVILTAGGTPTKLGVPGELEYAGRGVSYCAVCDGAFFKGETIAVVGGGDAAVEEADYLTRYAEKVYVIHRRDEFRASKILQERLFANPKIEVIWNKRVLELDRRHPRACSRSLLEDTVTGEHPTLEATGCFVFIGFRPNTGLVKEHFAHDASGYIITDDRMMTSIPGLFAAGDLRVQLTRQVTTAVGRRHDGGHRGREVSQGPAERRRWESRSVSELEVVALPNGQFAENCYLVADRRTREAVIIDPGEEPAMFLAELDTRAWTLRAIWLTHAHVDHIMGVGAGAARHRCADPSPSRSTARSTTRSPSSAPGWASRSTRRRRPTSRSSRARRCGWAASTSRCGSRRGTRRGA